MTRQNFSYSTPSAKKQALIFSVKLDSFSEDVDHRDGQDGPGLGRSGKIRIWKPEVGSQDVLGLDQKSRGVKLSTKIRLISKQ